MPRMAAKYCYVIGTGYRRRPLGRPIQRLLQQPRPQAPPGLARRVLRHRPLHPHHVTIRQRLPGPLGADQPQGGDDRRQQRDCRVRRRPHHEGDLPPHQASGLHLHRGDPAAHQEQQCVRLQDRIRGGKDQEKEAARCQRCKLYVLCNFILNWAVCLLPVFDNL